MPVLSLLSLPVSFFPGPSLLRRLAAVGLATVVLHLAASGRAQIAPATSAAEGSSAPLQALPPAPFTSPVSKDQPIALSAFKVDDSNDDPDYDPTGMDGPEIEMNDPPFSNDLLSGEVPDDELTSEMNMEIQLASGASPADIAAGLSRIALKGFPTPKLRNGFTQVGMPEVLNTASAETIQGPTTSVTGKAAPGGIQNFVTNRPKGKRWTHVTFGASSRGARSGTAETTGVLKAKRAWHRLAVAWSERFGPEKYAFNRQHTLNGSVIWRLNRAMSTMLQVDYDERFANASPGLPEYRPTATAKIVGPWRPLAGFHAYGPNAGLRKRTASASLQFEGQLGRRYSVRAAVQGFLRELDQDTWTQGQFVADTQKFGGLREPIHTEQPFRALNGQVEITGRYALEKSDHKVTASIENSHTDFHRAQSALPTAVRLTLLPADVRTFDPAAPNYFRPAFDPAVYSRYITRRRDIVDYTSLFLSERLALAKGRLVMTAGVRSDFVTVDVTDSRPAAAQPRVHDKTREFSHHLGGNYILIKGRVLVFANTSTAFEPSTRVDERTGRVQGNETTLGYETGAKMLFFDRRLNATAFFFHYRNQNISRRNPLYNDPILDAAQTQPQLVAAGEETFTGAAFDVRGKLTPRLGLNGRLTYNQAETTQSPDLPEEVGRPLTRLPHLTWALSTRYSFGEGVLQGLGVGATATFISSFVGTYENASRRYLEYPSYVLLNLNAGYSWQRGKSSHSLGVSVRNALNRNLLTLLARPDSGREFNLNYSVAL